MGKAISIERAKSTVPDELVESFFRVMSRCEGTFAECEASGYGITNELMRLWMQADLQRRADELDRKGEIRVGDVRYRKVAKGTGRYHTLSGAVAVRRALYRLVGVHNGPTVVPLEIQAGIWHDATPALAFSLTQGFASHPLRHYEVALAAANRLVPSRHALERIAKEIGADIADGILELEPWIRLAEPLVDSVCSISFGLDRTSAPMSEPIPGAPVPEPRIRQRPAPVMVSYRMVYVGTVSLNDRDGRVLSTKTYAATPNGGPSELLERIAAELLHQHGRYRVPISVIQDGAPELWNLVYRMCERHHIEIAAEVLDRYHVDERLADICERLLGKYAAAHELYARWRHQLDHSDTAIDRIIKHLDALVWHSMFGVTEGDDPPSFWFRRNIVDIRGEKLKAISGHLEYFRRNRARLRYATRKRTGLPIGSGPTEGGCKSLVATRCKRSGQRWFDEGLSSCLAVRALHLSDRLRPAFDRIAAAQMATLRAA
jgi:hypothetical protein